MAGSEMMHDEIAPPLSPAVPDDTLTSDVALENGIEPRLKMRGRDRLLRGLQRMSPSSSLTRAGRSRSASTPCSVSGAFSCTSLGPTSSPFGQPSAGSYFSPSPGAGSSSAHTSVPTSPIPETLSQEDLEAVLASRPVELTLPGTNTISLPTKLKKKTKSFSLWASLPYELRVHVLSFFQPKELVRISRVSREFYKICFDGQLWTRLDASEFYREIPAESLAKIIESAGSFVKDLNLRGCLQVEHYQRAEVVVKACRNLVNATLEGCRNFKRATLHSLLKANDKLAHLNLTGLPAVNNATCKIISSSCPQLEVFNVSWCKQMDARGIKFVVEGCPKLKDLRAGEVRGFNNIDVAEAIFRTNNLERLVLAGCDGLTDAALRTMIQGPDPEIDYATGRPMVPPRKLRHLDLTRCSRLSSAGVKTLGHLVPDLEGLQLSGVTHLTDAALEPILASTPRLTHLELEDLSQLTNSLFSQHLAKAPCATGLEHLSISYCELIGDVGMLPVMRNCTALRSVDMDNTRVSDLVLAEAAAMVRSRAAAVATSTTTTRPSRRPNVSLTLVVYDCPHITWTGIREVLNRNTEPPSSFTRDKAKSKITVHVTTADATTSSGDDDDETPTLPPPPPAQAPTLSRPAPTEVIALRCFHGWQMTVDEHTKRVLRGDVAAAARLERKWADYMQANEEAGMGGSGGRRRRRRAREAQMVHDEEGGVNNAGAGGRRRARTTGCVVM